MNSEIYWINENIIPANSLGTMARPRGNDWLEGEIKSLKDRDVSILVSLLDNWEADELGLSEEAALCAQFNIDFINYQIEDINVPSNENQFIELVFKLKKQILDNKKVVIHCRMGIGRSSMLAACVLISLGIDTPTVFDKISKFRKIEVPDTQEQVDWVTMIADRLA